MEQIRAALRRNKLKKFIALILATALWFFVMSSQDPVINGRYDVPISVVNMPPKFKAIYDEEQTVRVRLSAPRSYFIDYNESNIRALANLENYGAEGEYDVPIEMTYPKGFDIENFTPDKIHVKIDPYVEKQIAAEVIVTGAPMANSVVKGIEKSNNYMTLIGAKTAVESVKRVIGYIGLSGNNETFELPVPMSAIDEDGREVSGVRVVPSVINATVRIESDFLRKTVPVEANFAMTEGREVAKVVVTPESVEISGKISAVSPLESLKTVLMPIMANQSNFNGKLKITVPEGVSASVTEVEVAADFIDKKN